MTVFETLYLIFTAGIFLIALLTFIAMLIIYITKNGKNNAPLPKAGVIFPINLF